ncbi:NAD(P)-dependent dehydrogenase (short-subunit alcohol dehydrogenase family) [Sphingobium sp. B7D2B]|uniref:SDR family NAD(P)-dependent oxidoreductase n=1 Tax=Sphingobium sp. B7D2B TaxID=2940583 RepID=UPI002224FF9E|nr:SDR family NAD(P)-dependent oxidoreductase [Sphingobium sp. B7D2B]MCW2367770.1 NAD(P)-dependent dehydrogenase (short-subunit alcohol dehydrogenase family) [Sphingobium sp. B7D2B]
MLNVSGKTAFITGGASGMGWGMAKAFGEAGMRVIIADIRQDALDQAMEGFAKTNLAVHAIKLDVADRDGWARAADEAEAQFGKIHVLALNAGVGVTGSMLTATYKDWDFNMSVNVGGVVNGLVTMLPRMLKHGEEGQIVVTSSTGGFSAVGNAGLYCAAKFCVAGMFESLATDLRGTALGASVFFPGPVQTQLGSTTDATRPEHLRNDAPPPAPEAVGAKKDARPAPGFDPSLFMSSEEVGERVLRGIRRRDLFIMTHPEFQRGIEARSKALVRAIPVEAPNEARANLVAQFGTLMYNPIYDEQQPLDEPL